MRNLAANRQNFHSGEEGLPAELSTRAIEEYLAVLDEEAFGAASQVVPPPPGVPIGPEGEVLTKENLPPPEKTRWVSRRKAQVVAAVKGGLLTPNEAWERYQMSSEELKPGSDCSIARACRGYERRACNIIVNISPNDNMA